MQPGYLLPAEWATQSAVLLTWPREDGDWQDNFVDVEANFIEIARHIALYQAVIIGCESQSAQKRISSALEICHAQLANITFTIVESNDVWARDHGPVTVINNNDAILLDFVFNGWGGKYPAERDNEITQSLYKQGVFIETPIQQVNCVLEGGAIDSNGEGVLLTTTGCLPLSSRNPGMSIEQFETLFEECFGIHTVHWLNHGRLLGDDTDGHIDTIARFTDPESIVFQGCTDESDEHYQELAAMLQELKALRQPNGQPYTLHALPLPQAIHNQNGQRLPASYANFLIINDAILMPSYDDPEDETAAEVLANCFPNRNIHSIDCRTLIQQYGSLHCVTMQIPAQVRLSKA